MNRNDTTSKGLNLDIIEKLFKFSAIIAGFLYILGLTITNMYLGQFGISDISPFRIQYIITGTVFILFLVSPYLPIIAIFPVFRVAYQKEHHVIGKISAIIITILTACLLTFILFSVLNILFTGTAQRWSLFFYTKTLLQIYCKPIWFFSLFALFYLGYRSFRKLKLNHYNKREFFVYFIIALAVLIVSLIHYSEEIHPKVNAVFCGGKPIKADILISQEGIPNVISLELDLNAENYLRNAGHRMVWRIWVYTFKLRFLSRCRY